MSRVIVREQLAFRPGLGRHVNHDSASKAYRVAVPADVPLRDVVWPTTMPVLSQGTLGSCTGNAGVACLARHPQLRVRIDDSGYDLDESGAVALYSAATALDEFRGAYPPEDTGSDGLSVAKALKQSGEIDGYLWAFTPQEARAALMVAPEICGIPWFESMYDPDPSTGRVRVDVSSGLAGGHEICVDGYEVAESRVWFVNSWGPGWGVRGRAWLAFEDWSALLARQGDVTQFVIGAPPTPVPPLDPPSTADASLWEATRTWSSSPHAGTNRLAARAVRAWARAKGIE